ncbi:PREDICTED: uncharacterized protein LOC104704982 [Camelina sativa]|uniref:Uncharacterized protein LOC104704982 n=1 Tax=Camelina sativa TaxID=90675 RepID=A0ABM0T156_CAMSA|nr:PREDICTED: uncharacterized protein LOC104704982 [Camelina sativa]
MILQLVLVVTFYLRSLQLAEGYIDSSLLDFDCVDIYKQPAFQHPLLKHHKIQEKFSSNENFGKKGKYKTNDQSCPKGTVPILRQRKSTESVHLDALGYPGQHFAVIETVLSRSIYRGAEADISIHNVTVQNNQYCKSQIWLENGSRNQLNSIQVGWAVHPRLYGDSSTRFTIYWTRDGYKKTGCYNTICSGFIIVSPNPSIGSIFSKSSIYGGETTVQFTPQIFQDGFTGNWALKVEDEIIGYWPKELFTHLKKGASLVRFGGNTFVSPDGFSPPMGNGHFPVVDFQKSSSFVHVKVINLNYQRININHRRIKSYTDSKCFRVMNWGYSKTNGVAFSFGGPGGHCGI